MISSVNKFVNAKNVLPSRGSDFVRQDKNREGEIKK